MERFYKYCLYKIVANRKPFAAWAGPVAAVAVAAEAVPEVGGGSARV
jgi:hypothetical protein